MRGCDLLLLNGSGYGDPKPYLNKLYAPVKIRSTAKASAITAGAKPEVRAKRDAMDRSARAVS
jgi:hypothetical protein